MNLKISKMKTLILFLIMLISISAFSQEKQFHKACQKNTIKSYNKFIKKFPNSDFTDSAAYNKALLLNSQFAYRSFIKNYQTSALVCDALHKLSVNSDFISDWEDLFENCKDKKYKEFAENRYYDKIITSNNYNHYEKFIELLPDSKYIEDVQYRKAQLLNKIHNWDYFIDNYPNSEHLEDAEFLRVKISKLLIELQYFKTKYPNSTHINDIDDLVADLTLWKKAIQSGEIEDYQKYLKQSKIGTNLSIANDSLLNIIKRKIDNTPIPVEPVNHLILDRIKSIDNEGKQTFRIQYLYAGSKINSRINAIEAHYEQERSERYGQKEVDMWISASLMDYNASEFENELGSTLIGKVKVIIGEDIAVFNVSDVFKIGASGSYFIDENMEIIINDELISSFLRKGNLTYKEKSKNGSTTVSYSFCAGVLESVGIYSFGEKDGYQNSSMSSQKKDLMLRIVDKELYDIRRTGVIQVIFGNIKLLGYKFYSDNDDPLVFKMSKEGYVYLRGKGKIIDTLMNKEWNL